MKLIGMIGGASWMSSAEYYRLANRMVAERLGGLRSARILMYSMDFEEMAHAVREDLTAEAERIMARAGRALGAGGADFIVICSNTTHKYAEAAARASGLPVLHVADVTGEAITKRGFRKVGLLGTRFTMEQDFLRRRLEEGFGIEVLVPDEEDRAAVHRVIYEELCRDVIREGSRAEFVEIISRLVGRGSEGVILGCTEIPLLVREEDVSVPLFDTTRLHAEAAVERALSG